MNKVEKALSYELSLEALEQAIHDEAFVKEYTRSCLDELVIEKAFDFIPAQKVKKKKGIPLFFKLSAAAALLALSFLLIKQMAFPVIGKAVTGISLIRNGQTERIEIGSDIVSGDQLVEGSVLLNDGSGINIAKGSRVTVNFDKSYEFIIFEGQITADVKPQSFPMILHCGTTKATVLGTRFAISKYDRESVLSVEEGKVKWSRGSEEIIVNAGQKSVSVPGQKLSTDNAFNLYRIAQLENTKFSKPLVHFISEIPENLKAFKGAGQNQKGRWGKVNLSFDGIFGNRFELPFFDGLNSESFTAGVWFKPEETGGHRQGIFSQRTVILRQPKGGGRGWSFLISRSGNLEFWYASKELYWEWMKSTRLKKGQWYFAAVTIKNKGPLSEIVFYLNGKEIDRHEKVYTAVDTKSNRLHIGGMSSQTQLESQVKRDNMEFEGDIDEFFILPSILTSGEIRDLYEKGLRK